MLTVPAYRPKASVVSARCWSRLDAAEINRLLADADWGPVFDSDRVDAKWECFLEVTRPILDSLAPLKRRIVRNSTAPFVTSATRDLMARRRAALRDGNRDAYKSLNRQVRSAMRRDTREEIDRRLSEAGPSGMWRAVQPIIGSKRAAGNPPSADADALNRYFVQVGSSTARQVDSTGPELPPT